MGTNERLPHLIILQIKERNEEFLSVLVIYVRSSYPVRDECRLIMYICLNSFIGYDILHDNNIRRLGGGVLLIS